MAIDNEDKRRSAGSHFATTVYPVPDADMDEGDRAHVAWVYRDFDFDEPASGGTTGGRPYILDIIG